MEWVRPGLTRLTLCACCARCASADARSSPTHPPTLQAVLLQLTQLKVQCAPVAWAAARRHVAMPCSCAAAAVHS